MRRKAFFHFGKSIYNFSTSAKCIYKSSKTDESKKNNSFDRKSILDECFENLTLTNDPEHEQQNYDQTESATEEAKLTGGDSLHQNSESASDSDT